MPKEERITSLEDLTAGLVVEERQVVRNLSNDRASGELADLRSGHSKLGELGDVGTTFRKLNETLEDPESVIGTKDM